LNQRRIPTRPPEPVDAEGFHNRGNRHGRNGSYELAIADYNKAIELDPNLADAYYDRGISFYEVERFDDSITDLTRAINLNPDADHSYAQRSLAYIFTDRIELAQADEDTCEEIRNRD